MPTNSFCGKKKKKKKRRNILAILKGLLEQFSTPLLPSVQIQRFFFFLILKKALCAQKIVWFFHLLADLIKNNSFPFKLCLIYSLKPSQLQYYHCERSCLHFNESSCGELKGKLAVQPLKMTQMHFYAQKCHSIKILSLFRTCPLCVAGNRPSLIALTSRFYPFMTIRH